MIKGLLKKEKLSFIRSLFEKMGNNFTGSDVNRIELKSYKTERPTNALKETTGIGQCWVQSWQPKFHKDIYMYISMILCLFINQHFHF